MAALSFVTFVVKKLGELLLQEALNLRGVRPQVEQLQAQLNRMERFFEAADARPKGGEDEIIIRNCVAEIREASNDAEPAIAAFVVKIAFRTSVRIVDTQKINKKQSHTQMTHKYLRGSAQCLRPRTKIRVSLK
ncbi:hypothetical protein ACSBR1_018868 [Camellia fascicularis]